MNLDLFLEWCTSRYALRDPEHQKEGISTSEFAVENKVKKSLNRHDGYCGYMLRNQIGDPASRVALRRGVEEMMRQLPAGMECARQRAQL
jgi:hypothetical protein